MGYPSSSDRSAEWNPKYWIGVDLDGTLFKIIDHQPPFKLGPAIPEMLARVRLWVKERKTVKILTARCAWSAEEAKAMGSPPSCYPKAQRRDIRKHLAMYGLAHLEIRNKLDPYCVEIWNDRAIRVDRDEGTVSHQIEHRNPDGDRAHSATLVKEVLEIADKLEGERDHLDLHEKLELLINAAFHGNCATVETKFLKKAAALIQRYVEEQERSARDGNSDVSSPCWSVLARARHHLESNLK
jgi:hypothetical protein